MFIDPEIFSLAQDEEETKRDAIEIDKQKKSSPAVAFPPMPPPVQDAPSGPESPSTAFELASVHNSSFSLGAAKEDDPFGDAMATKFERLYADLPHKRESARKSEDSGAKESTIDTYCWVQKEKVRFFVH